MPDTHGGSPSWPLDRPPSPDTPCWRPKTSQIDERGGGMSVANDVRHDQPRPPLPHAARARHPHPRDRGMRPGASWRPGRPGTRRGVRRGRRRRRGGQGGRLPQWHGARVHRGRLGHRHPRSLVQHALGGRPYGTRAGARCAPPDRHRLVPQPVPGRQGRRRGEPRVRRLRRDGQGGRLRVDEPPPHQHRLAHVSLRLRAAHRRAHQPHEPHPDARRPEQHPCLHADRRAADERADGAARDQPRVVSHRAVQ